MTQLQFLGTGTPNPDPNRFGPSAAILVNGSCYVVDAGAGVVRRAAAAGIAMAQLNRLFLTHLHSDHVLGYSDFILTPAITGRKDALRVWGPPGTHHMTQHILNAFNEDISIRLHGGEPSVPDAYDVKVTEYITGEIYHDENVSVTAFDVTHGQWRSAFGFKFETSDRTIVFSGDTTCCQNLIDHAKGCDILVHEVCSSAGLAKRTPEWQKYHSSYHTIGEDVGRVASATQPKLLLLNHLLPFGESDEQILREVQSTYDGKVRIPNDLEIF